MLLFFFYVIQSHALFIHFIVLINVVQIQSNTFTFNREGSWNFHICFRFSRWKLGLISWLEVTPWSAAWLGCKGIRGFFIGMFVSEILLLMMLGETGFDYNCLGTSSLSSILVVFISSFLLFSGEDRIRTDWSDLGLAIQVGEYFNGISLTTRRSHSSAIEAVVLSSPAIWSSCDISLSTTTKSTDEVDCAIASVESGLVESGSNVTSFSLGGTDLEYSCHQGSKYQKAFNILPFSPHVNADMVSQKRWGLNSWKSRNQFILRIQNVNYKSTTTKIQ